MKIFKKITSIKDSVTLEIESQYDLWYLNRLLEINDVIRTSTTRKVFSADGKNSRIKHITISLEIKKKDYCVDTSETGGTNTKIDSIRVNGVCVEEHTDISLGQYHAFELGAGTSLTLTKANWTAKHYKILEAANNLKPDLSVLLFNSTSALLYVVFKDYIANVGCLSFKCEAASSYKQLSKKSKNSFLALMKLVTSSIDLNQIKCLVTGTSRALYSTLFMFLQEENNDALIDIKRNTSKIQFYECLLVKMASAKKLLVDNNFVSLVDKKVDLKPVKLMVEFKKLVATNSNKIAYGLPTVMKAAELGAIKELMVSESIVFSNEPKVNKQYEELLAFCSHIDVQEISVDSLIHEDLANLCGICAILCFSVEID